jgi:hypothetical protein
MARSNNNNKLKAFVRFDGSGRIISSSLIVQAFKPKVGNWKEIDAKECCNYTTTTTTTVAPTTTTTTTCPCTNHELIGGLFEDTEFTFVECGNIETTTITLGSFAEIYCINNNYPIDIVGNGDDFNTGVCCSAPTTTTTTTVAPTTTTTTTV